MLCKYGRTDRGAVCDTAAMRSTATITVVQLVVDVRAAT